MGRRLAIALSLALGLWLAPASVTAQTPGAPAGEIRVGYAPGPDSADDVGYALGAYFARINDAGGLGGRRIRYIVAPGNRGGAGVEAARTLVERDRVALLLHDGAAPSRTAVQRYASQQKVPHLLLAPGAGRWHDPRSFPWTMGWPPDHRTEGRIYAQHLLAHVPDARIGILYQDDEFGRDYRKGLLDGLGDAARRMVVLEQSYEAADESIAAQLVNLKQSGANVFFNATTPRFAVQVIKKASEIGWTPTHILASASRSATAGLGPGGREASKGLLTALYLKQVADPQWTLDKDYQHWRAWLAKSHPAGARDEQVIAVAYTAAQAVVQILRQCGPDVSREGIMRQAANLANVELPLLLPGVKLSTSRGDHALIEQARLARFDGERWVVFSELYDAGRK